MNEKFENPREADQLARIIVDEKRGPKCNFAHSSLSLIQNKRLVLSQLRKCFLELGSKILSRTKVHFWRKLTTFVCVAQGAQTSVFNSQI